MEKQKFSKAPNPTSREIIETLAGIERATDDVKFAAEEEGLSVQEYEKKYRIGGIVPFDEEENSRKLRADFSSSEEDHSNSKDEEYNLKLWVFNNTPASLQDNLEIITLFKKISLEKSFRDLWNSKILISDKLNVEKLIRYLFHNITKLERLSGLKLDSKEFFPLKNKEDFIEKIKTKIKNLVNINKYLSGDRVESDIFFLGKNAFFYLRRRLIIEKLEQMIRFLKYYKLV